MTIRSFLFCRLCNADGIRCLEMRRSGRRDNGRGRRWNDARAWFEGSLELAVRQHGWGITAGDEPVCPSCYPEYVASESIDAHLKRPGDPARAEARRRSFVFCDICNPLGLRCLERRRPPHRFNHSGRRITDSRAWHEGDISDAMTKAGWRVDDEGRHVCPDCYARHPDPAASVGDGESPGF